MVFVLSVLNREYNFERVFPHFMTAYVALLAKVDMICVKLFFRPNSKLSQRPTQYLSLVIWVRVRVIGDAHITRVAQLRGVSISL